MVSMKRPRLVFFLAVLLALPVAAQVKLTPAAGEVSVRLRPLLQEDKGVSHITPWCDYAGEINGEKLGAAILDHPENPRHPVRWHARAYGLFAANPWGLSVFTNDKSQNGAMTIEPGKSLRYRYRVVIHPGTVKDADIAGLFTRYAAGR
jgi:hypothetical protein